MCGVQIIHDLEVAVALADRVILSEAGRVALEVPIPLLRPRPRAAAEFFETSQLILNRSLG
jgi:sulfonate transport system ATP-binding protein